MKNYIGILASLLLLGLVACSDESREFTRYEPGVYKGGLDPLVAKGHQELNDRFKLVQIDR